MRVIAGPEKKTRVMSEKERLITAYHEMGHAIVGHYLEHSDPVHKISIISRGQALGYTISMPQEDKFLTTRAELHRHHGDDARRPRGRGDRLRARSPPARPTTSRRSPRRPSRWSCASACARSSARASSATTTASRSSAASSPPSPTTPTRSRARSTTRSAASSRAPTSAPRTSSTEHRDALETISEILLKRETIEKDEFDGAARRQDRGRGLRPRGARAARPAAPSAPERAGREAPRPLPRPGLAGAEARGSTCPRSPNWRRTRGLACVTSASRAVAAQGERRVAAMAARIQSGDLSAGPVHERRLSRSAGAPRPSGWTRRRGCRETSAGAIAADAGGRPAGAGRAHAAAHAQALGEQPAPERVKALEGDLVGPGHCRRRARLGVQPPQAAVAHTSSGDHPAARVSV